MLSLGEFIAHPRSVALKQNYTSIKISFLFVLVSITFSIAGSKIFFRERAFKSSFSLLTKMLGTDQNAFSPHLNFVRLGRFENIAVQTSSYFGVAILPIL